MVTKLPSQTLIRPDNGAAAGDVLVIYLTGLGQTNPQLATGKLAARDPLSFTTTPLVTIGGKSANVLHSLAVPGFVGLYQIAVTMPQGVPAGNAALQVTLSGNASNTVNITAR